MPPHAAADAAVQYASSLLVKALRGETLSPREARTLARTAKDLVTAVPCVVILIIPLSPIGHVLVFSFIQRIFPDFFPSPFTERRQNLKKLYEAVAPESPDGAKPPQGPAAVALRVALYAGVAAGLVALLEYA